MKSASLPRTADEAISEIRTNGLYHPSRALGLVYSLANASQFDEAELLAAAVCMRLPGEAAPLAAYARIATIAAHNGESSWEEAMRRWRLSAATNPTDLLA